MKKIRVAMVGASMRARPCAKELESRYSDSHELCAVMDVDLGKIRGWNESLGMTLPAYTDFGLMCEEAKPDLVIISTVDAFHAQYVVQALDRKISAISEKPLCVDATQCWDILEAQRRNPEVFAATTHNARYGATARKLKELLDEGAIGRILSVDYSELLDLRHGLSYFRRWNSRKALSGGLQIHKSSHHFDKLNWLLGSHVASVMASGSLRAYGPKAAPPRSTHCHTCENPCQYQATFDSITEDIFFKHKTPGSYTPDQCIYSPDIDIEDYLNVGLEFANGVPCAYHLVAHAHYEGEVIVFEGERGRIESHRRFFRLPGETGSLHDETIKREETITIFRWGAEPEKLVIQSEAGGHGGADTRMYADLFSGNPSPILATLEDGVQAVLVGAAINEALKTGAKTDVQALL